MIIDDDQNPCFYVVNTHYFNQLVCS